ncbi:MAG: folate-binding protein [Pseudomonadota bacterium]|nr:folate-binding protein [Pseudomonadota bacterium]
MTSWTDFLRTRGASFDGAAILAFGNPAGELAAARDTAVVCDLGPLAALRIAGADATSFLQGQVTSDVQALAPGSLHLSAWCSPKGRVLVNFIVRRIDAEHIELLLPRLLLESVRKRLSMFVLRSKVTVDDASEQTVRIGIGGTAAAQCLAAGDAPLPALYRSAAIDGGTIAALPGSRFIAFVAPAEAPALWDRLTSARAAGFPCWRWLTIRAGVPMILPPTQDQFIPQMLNLDALGGISFEKGCYAGQEIVARTRYLGRLKERLALGHGDIVPAPGARLYAPAFGDQPCGTVINANAAPGGGGDFLFVAQLTAIAGGDLRADEVDGPAVAVLPLPYALPEPAAPRGRIA